MSATLFFKDLRPIALAALLSLLVTAPLLADTQTRNADFNIVNNGAEWITPSNAEGAPDDNCAGTSTPAGSWIQLSFPDFSLPGSATVTGIEVRVKYLSPSGSNSVRLTQSGAPLGQIKTLAAASGVSNCANTSFVSAGGDGDLWGTALTAAHFNLGRVGFRLTQDANTVDIDAVELTVHFTGGEENQPPVALCQNVSAAAGDLVCQANASASQVDNGSSDPDSDPISLLLTPSGPFALGDTAVTLTVSDDSNAQDSCSATVTVVDQTPPQIVLAGGDIDLSCGQPFMDPGASASDVCDSSVAVQVGGDLVDTSQAGTYVVTYDAQDASGNDAVQMTRTVTVSGGGPPVVSCNAPDTITPPDAPVSWTASADGTCQGEVLAQVTGFDCFWVNPAGKRVDKTDSCVVTFQGDTLTVEDSGGVNNTIEWTVQAEGASGDVTEQTCSVQVVRPGKGKKLEDVDFSHLLDFAQFGAGEGMTSEMILHNPSETRTVNGMIHLMDSEGAPLEVLPNVDGQILRAEGDWSAMPFSIAPMGHFALDASQAQGVRTGSASVRSDGPLAGIVRFTIPGLGTAVLPGSQPVTEALASVRGGAGSHTGAAFRNTEEHPITLRLALRDQQGRPVPGAEAEVSLEPGARQARLLDELFGDALPPEFSGELEIRSQGGSFVAVMLEFGSQPGSFTALPVTPLLKEEPSDKNQQ